MEFDHSERVEAQPTSANSDTANDETYTFVFQNNEEEEIRTIPADVLRRYPNCMLTRMVNSLISTRRTSDGGYILKDRNLEMVDYIINFMQRKFVINFLFICDQKNTCLTYIRPMFPLYKNQSIDLLHKLIHYFLDAQSAFTFSKLAVEALEKGVKYI